VKLDAQAVAERHAVTVHGLSKSTWNAATRRRIRGAA